MKGFSVGFLDTVHPVLQEGLEEQGCVCIDLSFQTKDFILNVINQLDGIVIRSRFPMDSTFLKNAENLKFIARSGAGMENIDIQYCESKGIQLFNAPEGNRNAVGEHALGMLLALFNQLIKADKEIRNGIWDREGNRGVELEGKTVGIIGYGNNGKAFADKLKGFDVEVLVYDKYKKNFGDDSIQECTLSELQQKADVISLHIPQNEETIGLISQRFIAQMKKSFYLINLSRGKIVDTKAVVNALNNNKLLGACLDVLAFEKNSFENLFSDAQKLPSEFSQLLASDKVILSPHVGGWTVESYYKLSSVLLSKIKKHYLIP